MTEISSIRTLTESTLAALLTTPSPAELKLEQTLAELTRSRVALDLMAALLRTFRQFTPSLHSSVDRALALHDRVHTATPWEKPSLVLCEQLASVLRTVQLHPESQPLSAPLHAAIAIALADYDNAGQEPRSGSSGQLDADIY